MRSLLRSTILFAFAFFYLSLVAYSQETGISGIVSDVQGGAIAGAKIQVKEAGGASFFVTSNDHGAYTLPTLNAGEYSITATYPGFATVVKKVLLLVGQLAQIDITLPVAGASVTTTVEASDEIAIDTTSSVVAGNVTPSEVQDVPINGRNYLQLSTLVPGIKGTTIGDSPVSGGDAETGKFQITMDGLQVSQDSVGSSFGQPRFSQDAIAQFQIITNRFDATAGRSAGLYVNTQSKSGSNQMHGGGFGYFRNSFFNASDPVTRQVVSLKDSQYGATLGGPIKNDKLWYFGSYEGEHEPDTYHATPAIPALYGSLITHPTLLSINEYLGRVDYKLNEKNHIFLRGDGFTYSSSYDGSPDPSGASSDARNSYGYVADWNRNVSSTLVNDFHAGFHNFKTTFLEQYDTPVLALPNPSITIGAPYNRPETFTQPTQQYRDDLFWMKGKNSLKLGAEFLYLENNGYFGQNVRGAITCTAPATTTAGGTTQANTPPYASFFPKGTTDYASWNLTAIQNYCTNINYVQGFGNYTIHVPRKIIGIWAQDDFKILPRLTINLGLRYDNDLGAFLNNLKITNGLLTPNSNPNLNFAPRVGFSYDPFGNGKTSIRGGAGLYYADINANPTIDDQLFNGQTTIQATLSGPGTSINLSNPFAGKNPLDNPTAYVGTPQYLARGASTPYSLEASFGVARQLPYRTTISADLVHQRTYKDYILLDGNLLVNPANPQQNLNPTTNMTAAVYNSRVCGNGAVTLDTLDVNNLATAAPNGTDLNGNPLHAPAKQVCNQVFSGGSSGSGNRQFTTTNGAGMIQDALELSVKHSLTAGFTGAVSYTWGRVKNSTNGAFSYPNKPFIPGIQQEWANGTDDQRHTLTVHGQYTWKYGLMVSMLYHFGSGFAAATSSGNSSGVNGYLAGTRTFASEPISPGTTCPVSTCTTIYAPLSKVYYDAGYGYWIMQRDSFRAPDYNRVDSRLQETIRIKERYRAILAIEAFNLFNHTNLTNFGTNPTINPTAVNGY